MSSVKSWIIAARLRTLPLAFSGILVGTSLAANEVQLDYAIAGLTLLTAIFLQVLSNFANDYGDAVSGVDSPDRKGPDRMVHSGSISKRSMKNALVITSILTLASGLLLLTIAFPSRWAELIIFLFLGMLAIAAAIKYTVGKNPYGYVGFGDLFVFLFFGWVSVVGTYYLQTKSLDWLILLPASTIGLFAVAVLNVNNIRDIESDKKSGKNSIPVRIGKQKAVVYHGVLLFFGLALSVVFVLQNLNSWLSLLFVLVGGLLILNFRAVNSKPSSELDPFLKQMALSTLLFSVLFAIGQYMG